MKNNKFLRCIVTVLLIASLLLTGCSDGPSGSSGTSDITASICSISDAQRFFNALTPRSDCHCNTAW